MSAIGILFTKSWPWGLANDCNPIARAGQEGASHQQWASRPGPAIRDGAPALSVPSLKQRGRDVRGPVISDPLTLKTQQTNKPKGH